jgi:asparagine synthase (glutamine-hydrolysing)
MSVQGGVWNFDDSPVDRSLIDDLSTALKQQGPDGESIFKDSGIGLIYRPFHTTAESRREKQPYVSGRGFILMWDGRLDNREELLSELRSQLGPSPTDLAIVAGAFDRWESNCFRRIIGDWAVSIWKPQERELLFATDFMAVRHIFYYLTANRVWWATDLSPLVLLSGHKFHIDDDYIAGYLAHDADAHLTPYREIRQAPPGQFVRIRDGQIAVERFWRFSPKSRILYKTDTEYEEHFRHLFRQSVRRRLRSDSPILAELSGGLDSSSIVCMADDVLANEGAPTPRLDTFSYCDTSEPNGDDFIYFKKIEEKRGRVGIHIDNSVFSSSDISFKCFEFCPLPGPGGLGQELANSRAKAISRGGYRSILSGVGGDEFMGGVPDPRAHLADLMVQFKLVTLAKQLTAWSLVKRSPWIHLMWQAAIGGLPARLGQYLMEEAKVESWIRKDFAKRTRLPIRQLDVDEHFGLLLPTRRACIGGVIAMGSKLAKYAPPGPALEEASYPFLDQDLLEFILSIPANQMLRPGQRRSLMRRTLVGIVPGEILSRRTKHVGRRGPAIMLEKHWDELRCVYRESLSAGLGYVDAAEVLKTICDARAGKMVPLVRLFWTISLEYWLRDLVERGLLDVPVSSPLPTRRQPVAVNA